jgi:UDP-glucose:(heptosyl)LPS alpha-1,3-glucosyltransferase
MPASPRADGVTRTVTIVAHDAGGIGGMERQLAELIRGLSGRGWDVVVVARRLELEPLPGVHWVRVRAPARPFVLAYPWFFFTASLLVRRHRRGILHATGAIVANRADVITVHLCHRAYGERRATLRARRRSPAYRLNARAAGVLSRAAERWCYRPERVGRLVGVSAGVARELARHFPDLRERIATVRNGVDVQRFRPPTSRERSVARAAVGASEDQLVAMFVAGEWEGKGLRHALEGLAGCSGWTLVVVGAGDRRRYEAVAHSLGLDGRVRFLGPRTDLVPIYQAGDAFVLPSEYETFSLVSHEAAACGMPLLLTEVGGTEELVEPGANGWFVRPDGAELARRLEQLGREPALRRRMGEAARASVRHLSWQAMVDGYERVYGELEAGAG